ncbi:hypothetical protein THF1C08_70074 [Vibrio jasicida]|uniref:Uncharacterized protein n=1 Tax=Vibrio jasicida TaxID=766224 RepID=A0AAU9QXC3_9VIBR|nr:hypothetical protein THF1C08_70074 [Vibrio jasicida]CAH1602623.1 hypothetical protein THF1A12_60076 [Vibrio jasicida]
MLRADLGWSFVEELKLAIKVRYDSPVLFRILCAAGTPRPFPSRAIVE